MGAAEIISRKFNLKKEFSRKFIHIGVGLLVVIFSLNINTPQPIIFLSGLFTILNYVIQKFNLMPAMESERKTYGTIFYPLSIAVSAIFLWDNFKFIFIVVVLILALADAFAAIVGQSATKPKKFKAWQDEKSLQGSFAMFIASYLIIVSAYFLFPKLLLGAPLSYSIWSIAFVVSLTASIAESISAKGSDNISVTLCSVLILYIFIAGEMTFQDQFINASVFALIFGITSYKLKLLTLDGSFAAVLMAIIIFGFGGWLFTLPLLVFFISSNILSRVGKNLKNTFKLLYEKSEKRDAKQVFANGGIASAWAILYFYWSSEIVFYLYLSSIAAANADTWATELGVFNKKNPRIVTTFKPVEKGRSGGISIIGSLAALGGSLLIAFSIIILDYPIYQNLPTLLYVMFAGFFASFVDSFLGATFQAQYLEDESGQITEKQFTTNRIQNKLISGVKWLNNDWVNFLSILTAPLLFYIILQVL
jgi:uncharacterized protein (TIGR00297 family)